MKKVFMLALVSCLLLACSSQNANQGSGEYITHTVKYQGETLGRISAWYTGSSKNWTAIEQANPGIIANKIKAGDAIKIPKELAKRADALPKSFITGSKSTVSAKVSEEKTVLPSTGESMASELTVAPAEVTAEMPIVPESSEAKAVLEGSSHSTEVAPMQQAAPADTANAVDDLAAGGVIGGH